MSTQITKLIIYAVYLVNIFSNHVLKCIFVAVGCFYTLNKSYFIPLVIISTTTDSTLPGFMSCESSTRSQRSCCGRSFRTYTMIPPKCSVRSCRYRLKPFRANCDTQNNSSGLLSWIIKISNILLFRISTRGWNLMRILLIFIIPIFRLCIFFIYNPISSCNSIF